MSTYVSVVISPATTTRPVVIKVSQATRPLTSSRRTASSTESEIWSAILSGWPSVTDSEVKRNSRAPIGGGGYPNARSPRTLLDAQEEAHAQLVLARDRVLDRRPQRLQVPGDLGRQLRAREVLDEAGAGADVDVEEAVRLARHAGGLQRVLVGRAVRERLARVLDAGDPGGQIGDDEPAVHVGVVDGEIAEAERARRSPGDQVVSRPNAEVGAETVDDPVEGRAPADALLRLGDEGDFRERAAGRPHVERVLAPEERADLTQHLHHRSELGPAEGRILLEPGQQSFRSVEGQVDDGVPGHPAGKLGGEGLQLRTLVEELAEVAVDGRVEGDPVGVGSERRTDQHERADHASDDPP